MLFQRLYKVQIIRTNVKMTLFLYSCFDDWSVLFFFFVCREFKRFQKRERLKFDTKLGMNSPVWGGESNRAEWSLSSEKKAIEVLTL